MPLTALIYTSKATTPVTAESVSQLGRNSSRRNAAIDVTGLLLYGAGHYLQVLEGSKGVVRDLSRRISLDSRHTDFKVLFEQQRPGRVFPEWNMGQLNLDTLIQDGRSDWQKLSTQLARAGAIGFDDADPVIAWVRQFIQHNGSESANASGQDQAAEAVA